MRHCVDNTLAFQPLGGHARARMRFRRQPVMPYTQIEASLQTGDLFLARGLRKVSRFVEIVTSSSWSHTGLIVRGSDVGIDVQGDPPLLWESTSDTSIACVLSGKNRPGTMARTGPMLVPLAERIALNHAHRYYDIFAVRHLYVDRSSRRLAALRSVLHDAEVQTASFPSKLRVVWEVVKERFFEPADPEPENAFYCSHLVSHTLQRIGLLPAFPVPESYFPADFSQHGYVPWLDRAFPGPEIYLKHSRPRELPSKAGRPTRAVRDLDPRGPAPGRAGATHTTLADGSLRAPLAVAQTRESAS
jgi:hypothetical protein